MQQKRGIFFCCCVDKTFISRHASPRRRPIKNYVLPFIIYTNKHKNRQRIFRHGACHYLARRIAGTKWSQSLTCQIQAEKSVAFHVINKNRWFEPSEKNVNFGQTVGKTATHAFTAVRSPDQPLLGWSRTFWVAHANMQNPKYTYVSTIFHQGQMTSFFNLNSHFWIY